MSSIKRFMEQQEHQGYYSLSNKYTCNNCMYTTSLKSYIKKHGQEGTCSYCKKKRKFTIDVNDLLGHILSSIYTEWGDPANEGLPYETREGGWQFGVVYDTYELFELLGIDCNEKLYCDIQSSIHDGEWCAKNPYSLSYDQSLLYGWNGFVKFVLNKSRYFFLKAENESYDKYQHDEIDPIAILDLLGDIIKELNLVTKITSNTNIYRVRVVNPNIQLNKASDLGPPPNELSTMANRMSPVGISMFYGGFKRKTAIAETYVDTTDPKIAVTGLFRPCKELTLIDLSIDLGIPDIFDENPPLHKQKVQFLKGFINDFTKPIERTDKAHIDYVPTQIITEFFRLVFKFDDNTCPDGIIYPSSKIKGEKALVIFADSSQCIDKNTEFNPTHKLVLHKVTRYDPKNV
jgi:transcription elongation factor Elf1